jgi:hypothetical protein
MDRPLPRPVAVASLLLFALALPARAQVPDEGPTSVGVAAPDSTRPVRAYRLPSWRWSRWTLGGNGQADFFTSERETSERSGVSTGLSVRPRYEAFWESEERVASIDVRPAVSLDRRDFSMESENFGDDERDRSTYDLSLDAQGSLREYVDGRTFLLAEGQSRLAYSRDRREEEDAGVSSTRTQLTSEVDLSTRVGVGVGRVRIVTPVIRALRVRERLRAVAPGASLSGEQVQAAARQLARRSGYGAVYDRPDKYFWRDFFDRAGLAERSPFETFYVADVLREPVGVRREGAEVLGGPFGSYDRRLEREEEDGEVADRRLSTVSSLGGFVRARWFRNVTLRHQLGVDAEARYRTVLERNGGPSNDRIGVDLEGQWLWVLADRVRLDTRLRADVQHEQRSTSGWIRRHQYVLSSDLLIFVENSLSFSAGANLVYDRFSDAIGDFSSRFGTGVRFSVDYILSRALE